MLNSKKLTSAVLIAALASSSLVVAPHAAEAKTFNDVPKSHWAYGVIDEVSNEGLMNGMGNGMFSPNGQLTRAQSTTILYNMAPDKNNGPHQTIFNDVAATAWYKDIAQWGVSNAIIFTQGPGNFAGEQVMNRQYMAFMTYNFIEKYYPNTLDKNVNGISYSDANQITDYMEEAVMVLSHNKLLGGRGNNTFAPKANLTRAEAATIASRVKKFVANSSSKPEQPPVDPEEPQKPSEPQPEQPQEPEKPPVNPEEPQKPVEPQPEQPQEPEQPPVEEAKPFPGDENAPEWMVKIGLRDSFGTVTYTYVTKPDSMTTAQWEETKAFFKDKEKPAEYPSTIPANGPKPQAYMNIFIEDLYDIVQRDKAKAALESGTVQLSAEEQKMIDLVNAERRKAGVPELKVSPKLCEAAKIRAKECTTTPTHTRPNGSLFSTVLSEVGLNFNTLNNSENMVEGRKILNVSANKAFNSLIHSSEHYKNMLNSKAQYIGVAYAENQRNSAWIQLFSYNS